LIAYRAQHGPFGAVADIKACAVVTEEDYRKLSPYLTVE
jgi:DNA uptake protein ComE-like DNA-binding protein